MEEFRGIVLGIAMEWGVALRGPVRVKRTQNLCFVVLEFTASRKLAEALVVDIKKEGNLDSGFLWWVPSEDMSEPLQYEYTIIICETPLKPEDFRYTP